ncbi:MAG: hypothetical protein GY801_04695, partial [bacterium]|nr:hypothetical protein [bacterium]
MHQKIDILEKAIAKILNSSVVSLKSLGGGRNSRVYRVRCSNGQLYVAKLYFRHKADLRDRLNVEFSSLQFLWKEGVRCIPQPLLAEPEHGYAIYEYIEGQTILPKQITEADIHETVHFLNTLKELRHVREAQRLPLASEACFSIQAVFENIQRRLERLNVLQGSGEHYEALRQFLTDDFVPAFHELTTWAKAKLEAFHMSYSKELEVCERTLSPSDFGFHNAIKRSHGEEKRQSHKVAPIVFLDFEY